MDAEAWDERYAETPDLWRREPNQFVVAEIEDLPPGAALDLAAGEGRNAIWLAERGWRVVAVDFSPVAIEHGREIADAAGVQLSWLVRNVLTYDPGHKFDLVLVSYLQLPEAQMRNALERAAGAVAEGGVLLVVGHALANLERGHGGPQDPAMLYEPDVLASWIPELMVERADHVERQVETEAGPRLAIDLVVRAVR